MNITPHKGRTCQQWTKVFVYYNLHSHKWSLKALEGPYKGLVVGHADTVLLWNANAKVSEAGRQRVLREGRKNVHAGIVGRVIGTTNNRPERDLQGLISYNPYRGPGFYYKDTDEHYTRSSAVFLGHNRQVLAYW